MMIGLTTLLLVFMLGLCLTQPNLPQDNYEYRHFLKQHYDPSPSGYDDKYCFTEMKKRKLTSPCKETNSFIHANSDLIRAVCEDNDGEPYSGDFRISKSGFQVTTCQHKGGSNQPPCRYRATSQFRYIVIRCVNGFPVHFDESFYQP